jgi:hypothetical protein
VLPLDVLAEGHLQKGQPHVQRLHDVRLASQGMVPRNVMLNCSSRFTASVSLGQEQGDQIGRKFAPMYNCLLWAVSFKITKEDPMLGRLLSTKKVVLMNNGFGPHFEQIFHKLIWSPWSRGKSKEAAQWMGSCVVLALASGCKVFSALRGVYTQQRDRVVRHQSDRRHTGRIASNLLCDNKRQATHRKDCF